MRGQILAHPFVIGELALGALRDRTRVLALLDQLPQARPASAAEVRHLIETHGLYGAGIGYIDAHLIASTLIASGTLLWTRDKPLRRVAQRLGVHADLA